MTETPKTKAVKLDEYVPYVITGVIILLIVIVLYFKLIKKEKPK